ncbi:protein-(glutamine-N5) methyltransferase, release factor-specific [Notoacmeibacter marinus]|uniref:Release factor glutamine methyltransferase n=1 Tax=Notoacmeibacter marinus TaxID=1876515 RepID=A0A231V3K9_9HYPH|nr:peptide chain release factor N(5)-glutamine methyltransferase [Notoacmeibacter marinus]OXT02727.1 protein-(glutamine-N5) methyltransferase, release factor-specific [Notoacmeibacter marinus]
MRLDTLLAQVRQVLAEARITDPASEARKLTLETLMIEPSSWLADPGQAVSETNCETVLERARRRAEGRPLYRLLGWREFHGLRLMLSSETLEPRDDTEALVDLCLSTCRTGARSDDAFHIVDLGTGTGAIALALLAEMPAARALGVDLSADALRTAERNADRNGLGERFSTRQSRWFESVEGCFDLIVSNPPYIESAVIAGLEGTVRDHDPHLALDGGADGLDAYRAIASGAGRHLRPGGAVAVEIGRGQADDVEHIFAKSGFHRGDIRRDMNGILRALLFKTSG